MQDGEQVMNTWHMKELGNGVEANISTNQICDVFDVAFLASGTSIGMAIFSRYDLESHLVTVYFTPEASGIAKTLDAIPCEKPIKNDLALLFGDQRATQLFFPELGS